MPPVAEPPAKKRRGPTRWGPELRAGAPDLVAPDQDAQENGTKECRPRAPSPPLPDLALSLLEDVEGMTAPRSLAELSSASLGEGYNRRESPQAVLLAKRCNDDNDLPPLCYHEFLESAVMAELKPRLFLRFLHLRGGLVKLRTEYSVESFERILKKTYLTYADSRNLPLKLRLRAVSQIHDYYKDTSVAKPADQAFYRLGLKDKEDQQLLDAVAAEEGSTEAENRRMEIGPELNHRLLKFYKLLGTESLPSDAVLPLVLPLGLIEARRVKDWISPSQDSFVPYDSDKLRPPKCDFERLEEFLGLNPTSRCLQILLGAQTASAKGRHHCATLLAVYLLNDRHFQNSPRLRNHKIYAYGMLARSLAVFNVRLDLVVEVLRRMRRCVRYDSDRGLVLLAKLQVLSLYGFSAKSARLYEHLTRESAFLRQSRFTASAIYAHINGQLRRCCNAVLEIWIAKRERWMTVDATQTVRDREDKKLTDAAWRLMLKVKNILGRVREILSEHSDGPSLDAFASELSSRLSFRRKVVLGMINAVCDRTHLTLACYKRMLSCVPVGAQGSPLEDLAKAYVWPSLRPASIKNYQTLHDRFVEEQEKRTDWTRDIDVADNCFEELTFILSTGLHTSCPRASMNLYYETLGCYQTLSNQQPHPRAVLLQRMNKVLNNKDIGNGEGAIGLCGRQVRLNLQACNKIAADTSSLETCKHLDDTDAIQFFMTRDGPYLGDIFTFAHNSILYSGGV